MKNIIGIALVLASFIIMSEYSSAQTYPEGMVSYWKFDEDSGTIAYDSVNDNDGTIHGASRTTGKVGDALSFDGSNDYIEIPDHPSLRGMPELTVEAWAYPTSVVDHWDGIVVKRNNYGAGNVTYQLYIRRTPNLLDPHPTFGVANQSGTIGGLACTETVLSPNQWYHFVGLYTDDTVKLYVNGTLCGEKSLVGVNVYDAPHRFVIGTIVYGSGQAYYFNGLIDEVAVYSRALTEEEIQQHHQNGLNGLGYEIINHPPILDPIGNKQGFEGELLEFVITASDPDPYDILSFSANNLPEGASFDPAAAAFSWIPGYDQAGNYEDVEFSVTDNGDPLEVDSEFITITIGNINRPPQFTPTGSQEVLEGEVLEFTVAASDPDGDNVVLSAGVLPNNASFNPATGLFTFAPDHTQAGNYTVVFYATDDGVPSEMAQLEVVITVGDVPTPPEMADNLVDAIEDLDLPKNIENSYMANVKKVKGFIEKGKITPAINQLEAFIGKVEQDIAHGDIGEEDGNNLIAMANDLIAALTN
jgi:hypothetical protein